MGSLSISSFILISSSSVETPFLFKKRRFLKNIQFVADLYSDYREVSIDLKERLKIREINLFNFADVILVSSKIVKDKIAKLVKDKKKLYHFPHGVDFKHFDVDSDREAILQKFQIPNNRPIVGYFGSLTMANDQASYLAIANAGYTLVLIGRQTGDYSECISHENIYFIGGIPYNELPQISSVFDVAIMAWRPSEWISNSNPKKTYEYLALGHPIVCNSIPEIKSQLEDVVYFADSPDEFVSQVKIALEQNSKELIETRKVLANYVDWSAKYKQIIRILDV
jgi:glycosyltransferase involved in cell wall biosynthesis